MNRTIRSFLLGLAGLFSAIHPSFGQAEPEVYGLGERNIAAHAQGRTFRDYSLFRPASGDKHADLVAAATLLDLDAAAMQELLAERPQAIRLNLRDEQGKLFQLELLRSAPVPAKADLGIIDATGRHRTGSDEGLHYQGIVLGESRSVASLSLFPNGDVMGLFGTADGNFNLGRLEDGSGRFVLYNDRDLKIRPHAECKTDDNAKVNEDRVNGSMKTTRAMLCNRVKVYWEVANNLFAAKSSNIVTTRNWVNGLFNQVAAMYLNENIQLELSSMYIWVVPDEYPQTTSSTALTKFLQYWNALGNNYNADLAHLLTRDNAGNGGGNGGLAYVDVLCNKPFSYGYSDVYGTFYAIPTFSWDVEVITHETGHNLGSKHTHWCGWNTGTGGTCGAIDNCYTLETSTGCSTCGSTLSNSAPATAWKGSVMSYCHLVARGINLANGFGTLPGNAIRTEVANASCLSPLLRASLQTTPICNGTGAISVAFDPLSGGTSPYSYSWANGAGRTQTISPSAAGTYSVDVIDSNGCMLSLSTDLAAAAVPGNAGLVHTNFKMPACCQSTTNKLELRTNLTANLTGCQSVYWIRSDAPVTSFAQAKSIFDTAAVTVFPSKSVGTGGAYYDVAAPASCQTPVAWYFTPVAVNKPHTADSITSVSAANNPFNSGSTRIGTWTSFPDQTALPAVCDPLDTPSQSVITVSVSGYTGRAGKMAIMVRNAQNLVIYQRTGLPGNGTYVISSDSVRTSFLEAMSVYVFDYNCTGSTTCTASSNAISASRKVRYAARRATMTAGCQIGTGIEVSFSQTFCTRLAVENLSTVAAWNASLAPNPASATVRLTYTAAAGAMRLDVTDILGKHVTGFDLPAGSGLRQLPVAVGTWAKGVYIFNLHDEMGNSQRMKLVVE